MRVLTAGQMREADRRTIEEIGVPSIVLMENAGRQVAGTMAAAFEDLPHYRVAVLAGRGNNGGDGFVVARTLAERGFAVDVFLAGRAEGVRGDARVNLDIARRWGIRITEIADETAWTATRADVASSDLIVDALFGTGLDRPLDGLPRAIVEAIDGWPMPIVAIDLPSGLSADRSEPIGPAVDADLTVALGAPKLPHVLPPAESRVGRLAVVDIGIPAFVIDELAGDRVDLLTRGEVARLLPQRVPDAHKGDCGRVLVVAGSVGKTGAAHLAAVGALRSGAGLVTVATPRTCLPIVASMGPEYMTEPLDEIDGQVAASALEQVLRLPADVIAVGPGLGTGEGARALVWGLLERADVPLVIDADALNVCAGAPERLRPRTGAPRIVTPHPGEMARLVGKSAPDVQADRLAVAQAAATTHGVHVVLKGYRTLVADPDGRVAINGTGNPGMATGGTGDVLTGVLAAWLAQIGDASAAARLGTFLHGLAGDLGAEEEGQAALTAGSLAGWLGAAAETLAGRRESTP